MANARGKRFTIFDAMEDAGVFDSNPANINSRTPQGLSAYKKAEFPMMVYHPEGKEHITVKATPVATPFGPEMVGEQRELINKVCQTQEELDEALKDGWHKLPISAIRKRFELAGKEPPPMLHNPVDSERLAQEDENAKLRKQIAEMQAKQLELEHALADASKAKK